MLNAENNNAQNPLLNQWNETPGFYQEFGENDNQNPQWDQTTGFYQKVGENFENYNQNPQSNQTPEFYQDVGENYNENPQCDQTRGFYQEVGENYNQNSFLQNNNEWNDHQPQQHHFTRPNEDNFNFQSFDGNFGNSNGKRNREFYSGDYVANTAKQQRFTSGECVKYAIKKYSQYPQPMKRVMDIVFSKDVSADGWEKINGQFQYHTKIRGMNYFRWGSSIDEARENVAEAILKDVGYYKMEAITWPKQILPFRLEQPFADAIEM